MGDTPNTNTATSPAASGGLTIDQVQKAIADALAPVAAALKPLSDSVAGLQKSHETLAKGQEAMQAAAGKALTPEALTKAVADQLAAQNTAAAQGKAKGDFVAEHLKGIPEIYHGKLGADAAKWADEAKAIREGFQKDLAAAGIKAPPVGSAAAVAGAIDPARAVDTSKLSGAELIALGVQQNSAAINAGAGQVAAAAKVAGAAEASAK